MGYENYIVRCAGCGERPEQIPEYRDRAREEPESFNSAQEVVLLDEGTFDPNTRLFLCTDCYIKAGMPLNSDLRGRYELVRNMMGDWANPIKGGDK
ncbi:hypothetical protein OYT88_06160 [Sporolactobacillus sp. CQH2019]|uniref:hypothetical protein n=1 Tax=Sporolactobacillus sp. CQH2019 TaxID=3023512 RepID=UPI00236859C9|nr:hypothetical protein [Sporolactobacillus sp. CQH2019]MDD9148130.1 hypothetical protein [Sporolactobacillus sp. CQH2019]